MLRKHRQRGGPRTGSEVEGPDRRNRPHVANLTSASDLGRPIWQITPTLDGGRADICFNRALGDQVWILSLTYPDLISLRAALASALTRMGYRQRPPVEVEADRVARHFRRHPTDRIDPTFDVLPDTP
jgi:hypothetical protein